MPVDSRAGKKFMEGCRLLDQRKPEAALIAFGEAETWGYERTECAAGRWLCWMLLGQFERAWQESAAIAAIARRDPNCLWDGQPWHGKRVLVRCLHGFGDTIQFIRYAPLIRRSAARLIIQAHPEMLPLLAGVAGIDQLITWDEITYGPPVRWDSQLEVMELPRAFGTTLATIPADVPYIQVTTEAVNRSRARLGRSAGPQIGLVWQAGPFDPRRSVPHHLLEPLLACRRVRFYSLQRGPGRALVKEYRRIGLIDGAVDSETLADTAADIINLSLVITVDTVTAHLAGALNRPVWLMLPYCADWRWLNGREDSPWYPTMRIFRQPASGDWRSVIARIASELEK